MRSRKETGLFSRLKSKYPREGASMSSVIYRIVYLTALIATLWEVRLIFGAR